MKTIYYKGVEIKINKKSCSFTLPIHNILKDITMYEYTTVSNLEIARDYIDKYIF